MMGLKTQLTYDDFAALPDDGKHYELLAGVLYVNPSPGLPHQHAAKVAFLQIREYFEGKGPGEPGMANVCDPSWPDFAITLKELWHSKSG